MHSLHSAPSLHEPLLHILLDIPWSFAVRSGWPLFALLAQLHLRTHGRDDMPATGPDAQYFQSLNNGLMHHNHGALAVLGAAYLLDAEGSRSTVVDPGKSHAMPILCALASHLLDEDLRTGEAMEETLKEVQNFFRQSVQS